MWRVEYPDGTRLGTFDTLEAAVAGVVAEMTKTGTPVRFVENESAQGLLISGSAGEELFEFLIREVT